MHIHKNTSLRDDSIECVSTDQAREIVEAVRQVDNVKIHSVSDKTFLMHLGGKLATFSRATPEVMPEEVEGLCSVMATGRSDYPNQINNVLAFPGIFRGALDSRARQINEAMKQAAAHAIADIIQDEELSADYIIPSVFNRKVGKQVAASVAWAAHKTGVARRLPKATRIYS